LALLAMLVSPLIAWRTWLLLPGALAVAFVLVLGAIDFWQVELPRRVRRPALGFRLGVAACHLLQPVVRTAARTREQVARGRSAISTPLPEARLLGKGVLIYPDEQGRPALVARLVGALRAARIRVLVPSGWEDYDARLLAGPLVLGDLISSSHPEGWVQVRVRRRLRRRPGIFAAGVLVVCWLTSPVLGALASGAVVVELARGLLNITFAVRRVLLRAGS
jgi:hypothetical protein